MPSSSSIFGLSITNWGPLTTPYTPAASCATVTTVALATAVLPDVPIWQECNPQTSFCVPAPINPSAFEDILSINSILGDGQIGAFYSPASACPSGYKTVGVADRDANSSISRSGFLATPTQMPIVVDVSPSGFLVTPSPSLMGRSTPTPAPALDLSGLSDLTIFPDIDDVLIALLEPSETAVWCCPSSMTANSDGRCTSALPSYTPSTGCRTFYDEDAIATYTTAIPNDDGQTTEGMIGLLTATTAGTVVTTTFASSEATEWVAMSVVEPLRLVYRDADVTACEPEFTGAAGRVGVAGGQGWGGVFVGCGVVFSAFVGALGVLVR